jgi:hypothetical protein
VNGVIQRYDDSTLIRSKPKGNGSQLTVIIRIVAVALIRRRSRGKGACVVVRGPLSGHSKEVRHWSGVHIEVNNLNGSASAVAIDQNRQAELDSEATTIEVSMWRHRNQRTERLD